MTALTAQSPLSVGISLEFMRRKAPELAKDIVTRIAGARDLATGFYGLSDDQWDVLRQWDGFKELMRQAGEELAGPLGITERIRRQARYGLAEGGIADLFGIISDPKAAAQHRIKGVEVASEIGGVTGRTMGPVGGGSAGGGGPLVTIIMPDGRSLGIGVSQPAIEGSASVLSPAE